LLPKISPS
jgi:hypothetical protein